MTPPKARWVLLALAESAGPVTTSSLAVRATELHSKWLVQQPVSELGHLDITERDVREVFFALDLDGDALCDEIEVQRHRSWMPEAAPPRADFF